MVWPGGAPEVTLGGGVWHNGSLVSGARPAPWQLRTGGFALLRAVHDQMPACLVELGFVSNPLDAWLLQERFFLESLARGIATAALAWRQQLEQPLTAPAAPREPGGGTRAR